MPLLRAVPVMLSAGERTTLKKRVRGAKTAHRDRLRAQIVLAAARGRDNARIAADLQITADTVRKNFPGHDLILAVLLAGGHVIARARGGISLPFQGTEDKGRLDETPG